MNGSRGTSGRMHGKMLAVEDVPADYIQFVDCAPLLTLKPSSH